MLSHSLERASKSIAAGLRSDVAVQLVVAERGAGKTTLLNRARRELSAQHPASALLWLDSSDTELPDIGADCRYVLVDDLDRCSAAVVEQINKLIRLNPASRQWVISIGDPAAQPSDILSALSSVKHRTIQLQGLQHSELLPYLDHRLAEAGLKARKLLKRQELKQLWHRSDGMPGLINAELDELLRLKRSGQQNLDKSPYPWGWLAGVGTLVLLVFVAGIWLTQRQDSSPDVDIVAGTDSDTANTCERPQRSRPWPRSQTGPQ